MATAFRFLPSITHSLTVLYLSTRLSKQSQITFIIFSFKRLLVPLIFNLSSPFSVLFLFSLSASPTRVVVLFFHIA